MAGPHDVLDVANAPAARRSRVRFAVLAFAVALAAVTYLDRVCISHPHIVDSIKREMGISDKQMGLVFSAFTLAYAAFEMPTGAWGDKIGTRRVLTRIVVWWSAFTIATAAAFNYVSLLITRFLFGAGEAGAFPNVAKTFSRWFPVAERGTAQGIFFAGAHLGGGLTPLLVTALLLVFPWRMIFVVFGLVGFVWAFAWFRWYRDDPAEHPDVDPDELRHITAGRSVSQAHHLDWAVLGRILTDRSLVALCLMYFTQAYGFYFNFTWFPKYLNQRGVTAESHGFWAPLLAGLPLILSAAADIVGGVTTDTVTNRRGLRVGRCGVGMASLVLAGCALITGANVPNVLVSALLIALAGAAVSFLLGACWGVCQDIAGPHAGLVAATMNTAGQVGAFLSPIVYPFFDDPAIPICIAGGLYLFGAVCWLFVDPNRPIHLGRDKPQIDPDVVGI